ncbi:MAG: RNA pseudouridine synthase, partial [Spirochaetaceae bacterium]|nr:RNA pseudouridine synthase [Spirochaetaceae bacterium]
MERIEVLFESDDCLVLNKPAGLAVQGGKGVEVSLDRILGEEFSPRPFLVHRLDKDTSGLILVAKNREAAIRFSALFAGHGKGPNRGVVKGYLAVCAGHPRPEQGLIRLDLSVRGDMKRSRTAYRFL